MSLLAVALVPGLLAGWVVGGRLSRLADLRLRAPAAILAAAGVQLASGLLPAGWRLPALVASSLLVGAWLVLNVVGRAGLLRVGVGLLAVGWLLNVAVMVPNRGMPVSSVGLARVGAPPATDVADGHLYKHVRADSSTRLAWLGDVIPVAPVGAVVSVGDLVMAVGGFLVLVAGMARRPDEAPLPAAA